MAKETSVLWQKRVKMLVQQGLHKTLQGKSAKLTDTSNKDWEEMDLRDKHDPIISRSRGYVQRDGWRNGYEIVVKIRDIIYHEKPL